jgi:hypothetical protein
MATISNADNCAVVPRNTIFGLSAARIAHAQYNFSNDGGAVSTIVPGFNFVIPAGSVIYGCSINTTTACVGALGTMAFGLTSPSSTTSLAAATAVASLGTATFVQSTPVPQTASTWLKTLAPSSLQVTIATTPFSAGIVEVYVFYFESST